MFKKRVKKLKKAIRNSPYFLPLYKKYVFLSTSYYLLENSVPMSSIYSTTRIMQRSPHESKYENSESCSLVRLVNKHIDVIKLKNSKFREKSGRRAQRIGNHIMGKGCLNLAAQYYKISSELYKPNTEKYIKALTGIASAKFLSGEINEAKDYFKQVTLAKRHIRSLSHESGWLRVLGGTWIPAIGHLCMIDMYLKQYELGLAKFKKPTKIVISDSVDNMPNKYLAKKHIKHGIDYEMLKYKNSLQSYYDANKISYEAKKFKELNEQEVASIYEEFWEYDFGGDDCYIYTHGAAKIQKTWEKEGRAPLYNINKDEKEDLKKLLMNMGVPKDAWYVCLHVRESGFHKKWNTMYPSARDANIDTYILAIEEITKKGGWVIRMGDSSMKPMRRMQNLVDYCHSDFKSDKADILLSTGCKFFVGTNSGFATVPGIFGVPNVLTNWVPISLPLWFGQDLVIPKLFRDKGSDQYLSIERLIKTKLGAIQNVNEFPENIEIIDNSAEDIAEAVIEMYERLEGCFSYRQEDAILQNKYEQICIQNGSYKGSNLGYEFAHKYNLI